MENSYCGVIAARFIRHTVICKATHHTRFSGRRVHRHQNSRFTSASERGENESSSVARIALSEVSRYPNYPSPKLKGRVGNDA
jgi:hypothetical protein